MRILIIEDDEELRQSLARGFESERFLVDSAADGEYGSYLGRTNEYDVIVLDLILPKKDGHVVCRDIRQSGKTCPILILSVNGGVEQKVAMLGSGVDDYVTKPFSFREVMARIRALSRRPRAIQTEILEAGEIRLDTTRQKVTRAGKEVYLTRKEFSLLELLLRHCGSVISRGMIMEHVWNAEGDPFSNTIEAHMLNLRKKIGDNQPGQKLIQTVPGRGYKIDFP
jgi:DNA-binding response OmpR family regulator